MPIKAAARHVNAVAGREFWPPWLGPRTVEETSADTEELREVIGLASEAERQRVKHMDPSYLPPWPALTPSRIVWKSWKSRRDEDPNEAEASDLYVSIATALRALLVREASEDWGGRRWRDNRNEGRIVT